MTLLRPRAAAALATAVMIAALAGCSGSPTDPLGLAGCLDSDTGTIAVGVANTSGEPIVIEGIELSDASGVEIIDRFIAIDEDARSTAVRFDEGGRDAFGGVALDQTAIDPDTAAFVGVEVARTGSGEGRIGGLVLTVDGTAQTAPVTLDLRDNCG
ncbi:hypothetical protein [Microcella humidisoli]|uniref:Lipoprotein n=1 Tax=Microcella humidisoli TaxID=2963406 RepID=A0ABY5FXD4_9MICO|nr:hypothetical protein [Microcella humidisoli]UTT62970.1 hypothetical protein NNL39_02365 [Microcella humidisoli]